MSKTIFATLLLSIAIPVGAFAQTVHTGVQAADLEWGPQPPALPPGGEFAVVSGDPGGNGPYVVRVKVPAGYKIPAHTHPQDENVTVLTGSFHVGMGPKLDMAKGEEIMAGGYALVPKEMQHYAWFTRDSMLQIHGIGPVEFTYVDPADDPRKK